MHKDPLCGADAKHLTIKYKNLLGAISATGGKNWVDLESTQSNFALQDRE